MKKVQGIMDIGQPTTTPEARELISMVQYYRGMWSRRYHRLDPLTEAASGPKCRKIFCNDVLEYPFKEIKHMVSAEILLRYPDWEITFTLHTYDSGKQLGAVNV